MLLTSLGRVGASPSAEGQAPSPPGRADEHVLYRAAVKHPAEVPFAAVLLARAAR